MVAPLVAVKRVVDSSSEVVLTDDAQAVDGRFAGFTMSAHEECAVELAVRLGESRVVTLGDVDAVEQLRAALAVGCTAATHLVADPQTFGPADVARELAGVVREHGHDLVLLGNDAADSGDFQVGIRLAYELGWPVVNGAQTVTVEDGPDGPTATVDCGRFPQAPAQCRLSQGGGKKAALPPPAPPADSGKPVVHRPP